MKIIIMILCVLMVCISIAAQSGAGETYDLNGEWDAVYHNDLTGLAKDIVKITQQGNKFVGIKTIGKRWLGKGTETIKGELLNKVIDKAAIRYKKNYPAEHDLSWSGGRAVILEDGNKIIIQSFMETLVGDYLMTITLTRKK